MAWALLALATTGRALRGCVGKWVERALGLPRLSSSTFLSPSTFPEPPELTPAAVRVAESADVLVVIFEHCGLRRRTTLQRVCWRC